MFKPYLAGLAGIAALALGALAAPGVQAEPIADFYKNKTVTILVGYGAGGTYGRTSLLLGEYLGRFIPGKPTVIVQHMPGAGGLKATNYAYNVMPRQGYNLLMPPEMTIASEILRPKKVKFRARDFTWLGRVFGQNTALVVRRDSGVTTIEDAKKTQLILASSGKGSPTFLVPRLLNSLLGTKLKIVSGYKGSRKMQLSVEQGETQGASLGWIAWKSGRPDWFKGADSFATVLIQSGYTKEKDLPNVPLLTDLLSGDEDKAVASLLGSAGILGRGLVLPPGAPKRLVAPLRTAFDAAVKDAAFVKDAYKRGLEVNPLGGAAIQKIVNDLLAIPPATARRARALIFGKKS